MRDVRYYKAVCKDVGIEPANASNEDLEYVIDSISGMSEYDNAFYTQGYLDALRFVDRQLNS